MADLTEEESAFLINLASQIKEPERAAAHACARLAGSILGALVVDDKISYATFPAEIEALKASMLDEFEKFILAGGEVTQ